MSYTFNNGTKEIYKIDNFEFINQNGDTITGKITKGQVHTMNFFFTTCPSICPPMRVKQQSIVDAFAQTKNFKQYSISIDFKNDSATQLQRYAKTHNINANQWHLLRASSEVQLQKIANALKTNFSPNEDGTDFYHSSYVALIDRDQYIRGFYDILKEEEIDLLKNDIIRLLD